MESDTYYVIFEEHKTLDYSISRNQMRHLVDMQMLEDPQKAKSRSGYMFTYGGTAIY